VAALAEGTVLNGFEIRQLLGQGGFGMTYAAFDTRLQIKVAIKEFFPRQVVQRHSDGLSVSLGNAYTEADFAADVEAFVKEARILARLKHPSVIEVKQVFEANGTAYFVMPFAQGQSLADYINSQKFVSEYELANMLRQLFDGLAHVHQCGLIHRDIKPQNILRREDGSLVLLDFGAAESVRQEEMASILTPGFAPLEQFDCKGNQGPWTDIYALGATFYWIVTRGLLPPPAPERARQDKFSPASFEAYGRYNADFLAIIDDALKMDVVERIQSVEQWWQRLQPTLKRMDHLYTRNLHSGVLKNQRRRKYVKLDTLLQSYGHKNRAETVIDKILSHLRSFGLSATLTKDFPPSKEDRVTIGLIEDGLDEQPADNHHQAIPAELQALYEQTVHRVENFLRSVGLENPREQLTPEGYWVLRKGSADACISVVMNDGMPCLMVDAIVIDLAGRELPPGMMVLLLQHNPDLPGPARFGIKNDHVIVSAYVPVSHLQDDEELAVVIDSTISIADDWDDRLREILGEIGQHPLSQAATGTRAILDKLKAVLFSAAVVKALEQGTVAVDAHGHPQLTPAEQYHSGFIDFVNASEKEAALKPGTWQLLSGEHSGGLARMTRQPNMHFPPDGQAELRAFADFAFVLPDTAAASSLKVRLLELDARRNDVLGWFDLVFKAVQGKTFAFVASYAPSAAIRQLAVEHGVNLLHVPAAALKEHAWGEAVAFPLLDQEN
jgi:serine/threonine protein kinase